MQDIAEILGGAPAPEEPASTVETKPEPVAETAPEQPTTTVEQPAERPRNERGQFVKADEPAPAPAPEERPHAVPVAALLEERRKRQELEARLAALQQPKPPEVTDEQFWTAPAQATKQLVDHTAQNVQQQIQSLKYELAEDLTRSLHDDYDAVRDEFIGLVEERNPMAIAIAQQMGLQPNPAKFVYDQTRKLRALAAVGDPRSYEERIRADERAKVLIEMQQKQRPAAPQVPQSLNSLPSAPSPSTPQGFEPTPLENLFERPF